MSKSKYQKLLEHPKWQQKRLEILKLHGFMCMRCKDTETMLHVHHTSYLPGLKPWEYHDIFYEVLCKNCHHDDHFSDPEKQKDLVPGYCKEVLPFIAELFTEYPYCNIFSRILDQLIVRSEK